ncbi:MAG: DNA-3-methyladenine glycosylase 2 family protein [Tepidisphaeraceae bacterium]|jgi:3-methyladenine DNA glycosylase/8-oxoguanine DNA glycosylase
MKKKPSWSAAERHVCRDPVLKRIRAQAGPCTLKPRRDHFVLLCRAIYSQQISAQVARVLFLRFCACFPRQRPTPRRVLELLSGPEIPQACGLSRQKKKYLIDLANHFLDGRVPRNLHRRSDEEVIEALTAVNGIGRWTAEMFLIFVLNRPDVWPVGDFGLRNAVKQAYGMRNTPTARQMIKVAEAWRPHRTIASWYLWRAVDKKPTTAPVK